MQFWVQDFKPSWLPEGFQVPPEMSNCVQELCNEAEKAYYQIDKDRNGFLRKKEFKKAMKLLGINKYEARHMLIFVDRERLKVVSIKDYINAYLFIKSGGLNFINTDYQGPITTGVDNRVHLQKNNSNTNTSMALQSLSQQQFENAFSRRSPSSFFGQNAFQSIPRSVKGDIVYFIVSFKASNGMFLCSENGNVVANRPVASVWETFTMISNTDWPNFHVALRTHWNTYICCEDNNSCVDNRTAIGPWERFEYTYTNTGIAFKSWKNTYLSADAAGNVSFTSSIGPNETWDQINYPKPNP